MVRSSTWSEPTANLGGYYRERFPLVNSDASDFDDCAPGCDTIK